MLLVVGEGGEDDLDLVAEVLGEEGSDGPIGEATDEDGPLVGSPLAAEEAAGDASRGVEPLLVVHGEGEEVGVLAGLLRGRGCGQEQGIATAHSDGAAGLTGQLARLDADGVTSNSGGKLLHHILLHLQAEVRLGGLTRRHGKETRPHGITAGKKSPVSSVPPCFPSVFPC